MEKCKKCGSELIKKDHRSIGMKLILSMFFGFIILEIIMHYLFGSFPSTELFVMVFFIIVSLFFGTRLILKKERYFYKCTNCFETFSVKDVENDHTDL